MKIIRAPGPRDLYRLSRSRRNCV